MNTPFATAPEVLAPINPDWTISELVEWLADDSHQHDAALRHPLALIEAAVTGRPWAGAPSTVALIRSLAAVARVRGPERIGDLVRIGQMPPNHPESAPFTRFEAGVRADWPAPQVA